MSTPGQRAGGNGGVGWVDTNGNSGGDLQTNVAAAFRQVNVAREALEEIAARGTAFRDDGADLIVAGTKVVAFRCRCCRSVQQGQGRCDNRDCPASVAQRALDRMRTAS